MIIHTRNSYLNEAQRELMKSTAKRQANREKSNFSLSPVAFFHRYQRGKKELPFTLSISLIIVRQLNTSGLHYPKKHTY